MAHRLRSVGLDQQPERCLDDRALPGPVADLDATVTGEVGDHRAADAVGDVLRRGEEFDRIIVSTLPAGVSRWLRLDLVSQIERTVDIPVEHILSEERPIRDG